MTKNEVRRYFNQLRKELSAGQYDLFNQKILEQFCQLNLSAVKVLHVYLSVAAKNEPSTREIIDFVRKSHPHITICIPRANLDGGNIDNVIYEETTQLIENDWGIQEPLNGEHLAVASIDMALIPLLGFDEKGNRVGYGKGFYDRFLKYGRSDLQKIGLSFFAPVLQIQDSQEFDVPLNQCITPSKTYVF